MQESLTDSSPYVRKTGVVGVLKIFHIAPARIKETDMIDIIYGMVIRDRDPHVCAPLSLVQSGVWCRLGLGCV